MNPYQLERRMKLAARIIAAAAVLIGLTILVTGCTVEVKDAAPVATDPPVTAAPAPELTPAQQQAQAEHDLVSWVERTYPQYDSSIALKIVKTVCEGFAAGDSAVDVVDSIMRSGISENDQMLVARIVGEGVRTICPEWSWKIDTAVN